MENVKGNSVENTDETLIVARKAKITVSGKRATVLVLPKKVHEILGKHVFMIVRKANGGIIINLKKREESVYGSAI